MRCFLLNGAWLSHSAYDARMVNIVVAIALESVDDNMSDPRLYSFMLGVEQNNAHPWQNLLNLLCAIFSQIKFQYHVRLYNLNLNVTVVRESSCHFDLSYTTKITKLKVKPRQSIEMMFRVRT